MWIISTGEVFLEYSQSSKATSMLALLLTTLFTFVELNCENLFDYTHDEGKNDHEFLPNSSRKWDKGKYWHKVNAIAQEIISCGGEGAAWSLPDLVALTEVENDSVLTHLTRHSPLRNAGYEYVMTTSDDERGIDVALLYSPFSFQLLSQQSLHVTPPEGKHATRDILHVTGKVLSGDTLHVMVVHAPSRVSGAKATRPFRLLVAQRIAETVDSILALSPDAHIVVAGDFNDLAGDATLTLLCEHQLHNISRDATGTHGARGTYKHQGAWGSLDHILVSKAILGRLTDCHIHDAPFLLEDDEKYGGVQPKRTYIGHRYHKGYSDHLPLVARWRE